MTIIQSPSLIGPDLQLLIWGDRNTFAFDYPADESEKISAKSIAEFLHQLEKKNYIISNAQIMLNWSQAKFSAFKHQLFELLEQTTKSGMIFRKTFAESEALTAYTDEEWLAILAQYAVTYGWPAEYKTNFGETAETTLGQYAASLSDDVSELSHGNSKVFTISTATDLKKILRNIAESKTVLRAQQLKTLEAAPAPLLAQACCGADISVKETLVKIMKLTATVNMEHPLLKSSTDVLRFAVSAFAQQPLEGQIQKQQLKCTKLRIPSSMRRVLLKNLELIAQSSETPEKGAQYLAEEMFNYEMFWRRLDKYLRYDNAEKTRKKYPLYTTAIDLLYESDRSWTFNGRYSAAKAERDYLKAIEIAAERPGFMLRNLIEFLRMTQGVKLPVKAKPKKKRPEKIVNNPFQEALAQLKPNKAAKAATETNHNVVLKDASSFLSSERFIKALEKSLTPKLGWQLIELLKDPDCSAALYERVARGKWIKYETPIPGVNDELAKIAKNQISHVLQVQLHKKNRNNVVFIDENAMRYKLQYSGRASTELTFSGEFLSPGSELMLSDVMNNKHIEKPIVRLGVMWRALEDAEYYPADLDHNVSLNNRKDIYYGLPQDVYYGEPQYIANNKVLAVSSGDITRCSGPSGQFSVELVDLDVNGLRSAGIQSFYNSVINFNGHASLGQFETYFFFSIIDQANRVTASTTVHIDLAQADYAIRIDPDNIDNTGSYIGIQFDLENDLIKTLCIPVKTKHGGYSNVKVQKPHFEHAISKFKQQLTLGYALNKALPEACQAEQVSQADIVISRKSRSTLKLNDTQRLLHPGRDMEEICKMLF